ncbi:E4 ORF5 [Bat mastadenovirus]|nr:E4 ORF5 [Bat mastadenovirus]
MSLLPLPPPFFGSDVQVCRLWLESGLFEARQALLFYTPGSASARQLSCLIALLTSALHRLDCVCQREPARARSSDYQRLLWFKLSWLHSKYEKVRGHLIDLMLDGDFRRRSSRGSSTTAGSSDC